MTHVFEAVTVLFIVGVPVSTTVALALFLRKLRRANRVVPGRRSAAPLGWLWSWRRGPRMHRRLRRSVHLALSAVAPLGPPARTAPPTTPLHEVAAELMDRAVLVDDRLVAAGRQDQYWRRTRLAELSLEVAELERSAYRLLDVSTQWRRSLDRAVQANALPRLDLGERLDAVAAALLELPTLASAPRPPSPTRADRARRPLSFAWTGR